MLSQVAVVAIGRNEGDRLRQCLDSVVGRVAVVVYVDSGSTDTSVAMARERGVQVVALDMGTPFTAARARNAGVAKALSLHPGLAFIQCVDGDCEVAAGWLDTAHAFLLANPQAAAACGRRRERYPERSVFNRLCDLEWAIPPGEVLACGGDVMLRVSALSQVGGYRDDLIAGEEPELCVRLRAKGWKIQCLDAPMTHHDAAMTRWRQWWLRSMRSGHAYAEGAHLHGAPPERHWVRESRRAWVWGLLLPALVVLLATLASPAFSSLLLIYPLQMLRLFVRGQGEPRDRALRAVFNTLSRFPEVAGQLRFVRHRLLQQRGGLIEYK